MFSGLDFDPLALCNLALHRFIPRGLDELPIVAAPSSLILWMDWFCQDNPRGKAESFPWNRGCPCKLSRQFWEVTKMTEQNHATSMILATNKTFVWAKMKDAKQPKQFSPAKTDYPIQKTQTPPAEMIEHARESNDFRKHNQHAILISTGLFEKFISFLGFHQFLSEAVPQRPNVLQNAMKVHSLLGTGTPATPAGSKAKT